MRANCLMTHNTTWPWLACGRLGFLHVYNMHFVWFSMWDGFFSPSRLRRGWDSETRVRNPLHMENHTTCFLSHTLHFKAIHCAKCKSLKPCEMDLSHNCSLHGGMITDPTVWSVAAISAKNTWQILKCTVSARLINRIRKPQSEHKICLHMWCI